MKRSVPQEVFDSKEARKATIDGHLQAVKDLDAMHPSQLDPGNPNHPDHNDKLFGYDQKQFLEKQYK